jgi:type IV pilus assembly protein PilM
MPTPIIAPKNPKSFGLDIGNETIKAVQLKRRGHSLALEGYMLGPLPENTVKDGAVSDPEKLAAAIQKLLVDSTKGKIQAPYVNASLPASKIFTKVVTLPQMNQKDLTEAVHFETEQSIPLPIDSLIIDFTVISRYKDVKEQRMDVLIAAAPKTIVDSYLKLFEVMKLTPLALETELEAISHAMATSVKGPGPFLVVDIGAETTDLSIVNQGNIRLTGGVAVGGKNFTDVVATALKVDHLVADQSKIHYGMGDTAAGKKIGQALSPSVDSIVTEIRRMIRFYQDRAGGGTTVTGVVLSGGSSVLVGLHEYLHGQLNLPVGIANPLANITIQPLGAVSKVHAPIYTTAVGLALGGFDANH